MAYPGPPSLSLLIRHTGQRIPLTQDVLTIGRQAGNTLVLSDAQVSRQHATIFWQAGTHVIQDLGSANGTYVNGRPITGPHPLSPGYVIQVGNTIIDVQGTPAMRDTVVGAAVPPAYQPPAAPPKRSLSPIIIGLLLVGIVLVVGILIGILLLGLRGGDEPTVTIESPLPDAQVGVGTGIVLQATAAGAEDIIQLELSVDGQQVATTTSPRPDGVSLLTVSQPLTFDSPAAHVVSAVAYTAQGKTSQPTSITFSVVDSVGLATPTGTPSPPAEESPSPTTEATTAVPPASPTPTLPPTTAAPDTPEPTPTSTGTATPTSTATPTPTPTQQPPQIAFFQANPSSILSGQCTTIEWGAVTNATEVHIDQGIGGVATPGSQSVCPASTTTYLMTATGPGGTATALVTVTVQAGQPDLTVESIEFVPMPPVQNQDNEVRITIKNIGNAPAGAFDWDWQPGSATPFEGNLPGLDAGQSQVVTVTWNPSSWYANLSTKARVDTGNAVEESDETNNELGVNVTVVTPVPDVTVSLPSQAALDGFRANNGGGNNTVDIRVGNGTMFGSPAQELVIRGFMSFDLSGIPATAEVQSIQLRFHQVDVTGTPYAKLGNLLIQHVDYGSTLNNAAFGVPALDTQTLSPHTGAGEWYTITSSIIGDWIESDLTAGRTRTQIRLKFSTETDGDGLQDTASFESGENYFGTGNVPELTMTYSP